MVDGGSRDGTVEIAAAEGARVVAQREKGYGNALREGLHCCSGELVVTLDADLSHDPAVVLDLLAARDQADLVIASRYVMFGHAVMPWSRLLLSRILNWIYSTILSLPIRDVSSGYRLYRRALLDEVQIEGRHFDVLPELIVQAYARGFRVREIPFHYRPRGGGDVSCARPGLHALVPADALALLEAAQQRRLRGLRLPRLPLAPPIPEVLAASPLRDRDALRRRVEPRARRRLRLERDPGRPARRRSGWT